MSYLQNLVSLTGLAAGMDADECKDLGDWLNNELFISHSLPNILMDAYANGARLGDVTFICANTGLVAFRTNMLTGGIMVCTAEEATRTLDWHRHFGRPV